MANLQLNIEINDEDFKTLCVDNINELPKDKVEEILLKSIEVALMSEKENYNSQPAGTAILIEKNGNKGYWKTQYKPTKLLEEIMGRVDISDYVNPMANKIKEYIENNYEKIIKEYVIEKFADMLFDENHRWEFRHSIISDLTNNYK